jgi:hypothetical protein
MPLGQWELVDHLFSRWQGRALASPDQPGQEFDIYEPPRRKRGMKQGLYRRRGAEEFGAALRVIDTQA